MSAGQGDEPFGGKIILEQDRFLPIANISRLIKRVIPSGGKVSRDAKECIQECASEFISFITSEASERCTNERRKTITAEDVLGSMSTVGFENYVEPLNLYLKKYREANRPERPNNSSGRLPSNSELAQDSGIANSGEVNSEQRNEGSQLLLKVPEDETPQQHLQVINLQTVPMGNEFTTPVIVSGDSGQDENSMARLLSSGSVQNLELLVDPSIGQHYISLQLNDGSRQLIPAQVPTVATIDSSHIASENDISTSHANTNNSIDDQNQNQDALRSQFVSNVNEANLTGSHTTLHRSVISQFEQAQFVSQPNFEDITQEARRVVEIQPERVQPQQGPSSPQYAQLDRVPTQFASRFQVSNSRKRPSPNLSHAEFIRFQ